MEMKKNKSLDVRYACIHIFYWAVYCAMIGYASVFLLGKGFSNSTIGVILAAANILAVVTQPLLASILDKNNKISLRKVISAAIIIMILLSILIAVAANTSIIMTLVIVLAFTFLMTLVPFINQLTFAFEKQGIEINFGLARGLGSVAYAVMSLILGKLVAVYSPDLIPFFYVGLSVCLLVFVYTFYLPGLKMTRDDNNEEKPAQLSLLEFVGKYKVFMLVALASTLLLFDHAIINNFFIQVVDNIGGDSSDMGKAIFLAAMLELPIMAMFSKLQAKFSCTVLLMVSAIAFTIKHVLTYLAVNMTMIYIAQVTQMFAYAIFIPASVYYVTQVIDEGDRVKGQALMTVTVTLSGVFASLLGGVLLDALGVHQVLFVGAIVSIVGTIIMILSLIGQRKETGAHIE